MGNNRTRIAAMLATLACALILVAVFVPVSPGASTAPASLPNASVSSDSASGTEADDEAGQPVEGATAEDVVAEETPAEAADYPDYESGTVLVTFADSVSPDEALAQLREQTGIADLSVVEVSEGFAKLAFSSDMSVEDAVAAISQSSAVAAAQPNFAYYPAEGSSTSSGAETAAAASSSLMIGVQAEADTKDPWDGGSDWHLKKINAYDAWEYIESQPKSSRKPVTVAIIDVGFKLDHEDLSGDYVYNPETGENNVPLVVDPYNAYTGKNGISSISTTSYHGQHVAGIVAAHANNGKGVAGVTGNFARIMPIQAFDKDGKVTYTDTLLKCYSFITQHAADDNVRVINMSLGAGYANDNWGSDDKMLFNEVAKAYDKGIVTVTAACNVDTTNTTKNDDTAPFYCYPGDYGQCVTVMNVNSMDVRASNSNYNRSGQKTKDICAPGSSILSTKIDSTSAYGNLTGTSMATPVASGVLALEFSANPSLTADEAVSKLYSSAKDVNSSGWDAQTGYGRVDALAAVSGGAYLSGPSAVFSSAAESYALRLPAGVTPTSVTWKTDAASGAVSLSSNMATTSLVAKQSGDFVLSATAKGSDGKTYVASQTVSAYVASVTGDSVLNIGDKEIYAVGGLPLGGHTFTWKTSNASIASITSDGVLTARNSGTVTVTATDTSTKKTFSKSVKVNTIGISASNLTVSGVANRAYTGKAVAVQKPTVKRGSTTLRQGTDYVLSYQNSSGKAIASSEVKNAGTYYLVITGRGNYSGSVRKTFKVIAASVSYRTHVQNVGWQGWKSNGAMSGTSGKSLRLEGINIEIDASGFSGGITYRTHVQNIGWQGWKSNGAMSGTQGQSLRLEAIQIKLTGQMAEYYDVYYRVHCQNIGWMNWAKNGASAGSAGYSYRLEGIQIKLVPKGSAAPAASPANAVSYPYKVDLVQYRTHVQNVGWQRYVADGATAGTSGRSLRLEGLNLRLGSQSGIGGGITYRTHVQNIGWQGWRSNGAMAGTSGRSLRLEAVQIKLTGAAAQKYDVYYRVHCQNIGWMGWAKNGASAGTAGYSYRLEALQVKLVPKGGKAPGSTVNCFRQR